MESPTVCMESVEWKPDSAVSACEMCSSPFNLVRRRHHCRACGGIFCGGCSRVRSQLAISDAAQRVCLKCFAADGGGSGPGEPSQSAAAQRGGGTVEFVLRKKARPFGTTDCVLKIAREGVAQCNLNRVPQSFVPWEQLAAVRLEGLDTIVLCMDKGGSNVYYSREQALAIEGEISKRLAAFRARRRMQKSVTLATQHSWKGKDKKTVEHELTRSFTAQSIPLPHVVSTAAYTRLEEVVTRTCNNRETPEGMLIRDFLNRFDTFPSTLGGARPVAQETRRFLTRVRDYLIQTRGVELFAAKEQDILQQTTLREAVDLEVEIAVVAEVVLQKIVLKPLHRRLLALLASDPELRQKEEQFQRNVRELKNKDIAFFGVSEEWAKGERFDWEIPLQELQNFTHADTPHDKIHYLNLCAKAILVTFNLSQEQGSKTRPLDAEQFLPVFVYVVVQSQLPLALPTGEYLWCLYDTEGDGSSEECYYLTVFSSALSYVVEIDLETGEMRG
eukprot:TRINITY_DN12935_c0_g1_i1.p1 TRINITY_DN12935_c0_g1~~TRINITY_DN12935_c0_g1_i1.p1  ORF type:complete len:502 (+),score=98.92 TRINITY_DN12935_c0_g1_i1:121-1626(+)